MVVCTSFSLALIDIGKVTIEAHQLYDVDFEVPEVPRVLSVQLVLGFFSTTGFRRTQYNAVVSVRPTVSTAASHVPIQSGLP
jgi:hypothetical protein